MRSFFFMLTSTLFTLTLLHAQDNTLAALKGAYCTYSGSSNAYGSYSSSRWAKFDGNGHFSYGSSSAYSGANGDLHANNGDAEGYGSYEISGNTIILHYSDGSSDSAQVNMRQKNGWITEVYYGTMLYATSLCN
jgi:hypothetical protein